MKINILSVRTPSEKQVNAGILGNITLDMVSDEGVVLARLNGVSIRKSQKDGSRWMAMPSFKTSAGKYLSHFQLFPFIKDDEAHNDKQKANTNALLEEVLRILDAGGTAPVDSDRAPFSEREEVSKPAWM